MTFTRAGERQAGGVGAGWVGPAPLPQAFQTELAETAGYTAEQPVLVANMDQDPTGIKDSVIPKLRASLKMCKKSVDDLLSEVAEQVDRIESDKNDPLVPQSMITDYTRQLE